MHFWEPRLQQRPYSGVSLQQQSYCDFVSQAWSKLCPSFSSTEGDWRINKKFQNEEFFCNEESMLGLAPRPATASVLTLISLLFSSLSVKEDRNPSVLPFFVCLGSLKCRILRTATDFIWVYFLVLSYLHFNPNWGDIKLLLIQAIQKNHCVLFWE